jgi:hypothetical protein
MNSNSSGQTRMPWLVAAIAGVAIGCSQSAMPTTPSSPVSAGGTAESVQSEIAAVRQATAPFHDLSVAETAGYALEDEACVASPLGTMGFHAPNQALARDPAVSATQPEILLYINSGNGYRLTGVEYFKVVLLRDPAGRVAPWFGQTQWPSTYVVVSPTPQLFGQTFQGPMAGHNSSMPWHWDLHAWIWSDNPSGMFTPWNPSLSCQ